MRVLVTGASGFVGGALLRRLAARPDVTVLGVARSPLDRPDYRRVDLADGLDVDFSPDVVIHAAARASPWGSRRQFQRQNVTATREVVRFCERRTPRPRLVYLSTSAVFYRERDQFGLTEDSPIGPDFVNDYAASKYQGENIVRDYAGGAVVLRPRAVFGPGDTVLFPRIVRAARRGRLPRLVRDGAPAVGDLVYIDVLCDAIMAAAERPALGGAVNITNNEPVVIATLLDEVLKRLGLPLPRHALSVDRALRLADRVETLYRWLRLPGEPPVTRFGVGVFAYSKTFDVGRMLRELGPPQVSVSEGIERFIAWQRARRER